jgi:hypothetical protein
MLSMLFVILIFQGCSNKEIVYVDKPFEVKVPVKCLVPKTECDFNRETDTEVIHSLQECIVNFIENAKVCQ